MSTQPQPVKRDYEVADAYQIEFAKDTHENVNGTLADFTAFDPEIDAVFLAAFLTAIAEAEAVPSDEQVEAVISQMTVEVENAMAACRKKFQDSKYFIEKTFPNNEEKWKEFGYKNYLKARDIQPKMIEFMKDFYGAATKYSALLNTVNYTPVMIAEIETLTNNLDQKNKDQNNYINGRPGITKERIIKHNAVWAITVKLCAAGKIIYYNDYANYKKYLLPASDETTPMILKGKTTYTPPGSDPASPPALQGVSVSITELPTLNTLTDSNGNYGFPAIPAGTYIVNFNKAGYMPHSVPGVVITDIDHPVTLNVTLTPMP